MGGILKNIHKQHNCATFDIGNPDILELKDLENIKTRSFKNNFWFKNEMVVLDLRPIRDFFTELDDKDIGKENHISAISMETLNKKIKAIGYVDHRDYRNNAEILKLGSKIDVLGKFHSIKKFRDENFIVFQIKEINN